MAWLWNSQSIKYRKNGVTKSLIHLSDPTNDLNPDIIDKVKYLCVYKKGVPSTASNMYKIPMFEETSTNGDWYLNTRSGLRVRLNGKTYIPFLNAGIIRLVYSISSGAISRGTPYQFYFGCNVRITNSFLPIKLPATTTIAVQCELDRGHVLGPYYFTIPANNFKHINNSVVEFSWCIRDVTGKENVYSSNYKIVMYYYTNVFNSKKYSATIRNHNTNAVGNFIDIIQITD